MSGGVSTDAALTRCLDPVPVERFLAEHWERRPLVVAREQPDRFDGLLSAEDIERLICSTAIRYPAFRLVKVGAQLSARDYAVDIPWRPTPFSGSPDVERVLSEFERGATIVIQGLHHWWQPLAELCRELEAALGHPSQANAYYTPHGAQGLAVHHDTHDVFVLQVAGEKRWLVYEPALELPLKNQHYKPEPGGPGEPVQDVTLRAGDTLYLPRGWLHEALTSDSDSLHLTVGVNVYTWLDALRAAIESCGDDVELRRSVPLDGEPRADLLERVRDELAPEHVARRMRERFVRTRRPLLDGQLAQLRAAASLTVATSLARRRGIVADLSAADGALALSFGAKTITFPPHVQDDLAFVLFVGGEFTPADLPGTLDEPGRLALSRRLVREGLLLVVSAGRSGDPPRGNGAVAQD